MSVEENKVTAQKCFDALNQQDTAVMAEVMSPKWAAEVTSWFPGVNKMWAGHHIEVFDMAADGDKVWCRLRTSGLHSGEWEGLPPTNQKWTNTGIWFLKIINGRVVEIEGLFEEINLIKQLGGKIVPARAAIEQGDSAS